MKIERQQILCGIFRQMPRDCDAALQMRDGFDVGGPGRCLLAGSQPVLNRFPDQSCLGEMVGQGLGLGFDNVLEPLLERVRDRGVQFGAAVLE